MNNLGLYQELEKLLRMESRYCSEDGVLLKNSIVESALALRPDLIKLLLSHEGLKNNFFQEVDGLLVFDKVKFQKFVMNKRFLADSYTSFKNEIGLTGDDDEFLSESHEVVLSWPYKDCVLEGGQTKEDAKRNEVFWNEILAPDEINRLTEPKVLTGFKRYTANGAEEVTSVSKNDNLIIKGNNLLALHSLLKTYRNQVKLIYIDPPYNTGSDGFQYNDSFNHSSWLTFMRNRLTVARELLREDGVIFVQCDDNEQAYLKVLMDDVFLRESFVNMVSINMKNIAGASGGGEDKRLKKNCEFILIYAKNYSSMQIFNGSYVYTEMSELIQQYLDDGVSWKYTSVLVYEGDKEFIGTTVDGSGEEIKVYKRINPIIKSVNQLANEDAITVKEAYRKYGTKIFRTTNAQSSIRTRIIEYKKQNNITEEILSIEYTPRSGKNKGMIYEQFYKGDNLFVWLRDTSEIIDGELFKKDIRGTYWDYTGDTKNLTKEGSVEFSNGKKPEKLISQIIEMATDEGDIVLDYHLGSGTTAAVAHKMGRRYIGVEQMDYIETVAVERLKKVIGTKVSDGMFDKTECDQGGISKAVNWQGGGEFVYCELAKANQNFVNSITQASTKEQLTEIWKQIEQTGFLSWKIDPKSIDEQAQSFADLSVDDTKRFLIECLDKNLLYVPYSEIDNAEFAISAHDKSLNAMFYSK
jgi:adenine-specific DNA-methyltransferase